MVFNYGPQDVPTIKRHSHDLSEKLSALGKELRNGSIALADVRSDFEERYQPSALALVDAMTVLLPNSHPGISVMHQDAHMHSASYSDRPTVACRLPDDDARIAGMHFGDIASILKKLADALPESANA